MEDEATPSGHNAGPMYVAASGPHPDDFETDYDGRKLLKRAKYVELSAAVAEVLHGVPIHLALAVLDHGAREMILETHSVDVTSTSFRDRKASALAGG